MVEEGSDEVEEDLWEVGGRGEARVPGVFGAPVRCFRAFFSSVGLVGWEEEAR